MPSTPIPSAASAIVNQNRIGPRLRGFRGCGRYAGGAATGAPGGAGTNCPVAGSGAWGTGGALGAGFLSRSRTVSTIRAITRDPDQRPREAPLPDRVREQREQRRGRPTPISAKVRLRSSRWSGARGLPSSGSSSQQATYSRMPAPPKKTSTTKATRSSTGSMSRWRARPPATPASLRSGPTVRRIRPRSRTSSRVTRGPLRRPRWAGRRLAGASGGVVVMYPDCALRSPAHHRGRP